MKHLEALANIEGVTVTAVMGPTRAKIEALAAERGIGFASTSLEDCIARPDVDAIILATPTQMHADQAVACMRAGKPVFIEIPMSDSLEDAQRICAVQKETGVLAMAGQVRRYNPSHQWIHNKIKAGELKIQQMDVQTYFFRRSNMNAKGEPRSWTDHLLWHHACHTVDLFQYQTGETCSEAFGIQGPHHPELGIAMDMTIGMKVPSGPICTLSLSFNNNGPLGTFFRYICDNGTYIARYDDLFDGYDKQIDLTGTTEHAGGTDGAIDRVTQEIAASLRQRKTLVIWMMDESSSMETRREGHLCCLLVRGWEFLEEELLHPA